MKIRKKKSKIRVWWGKGMVGERRAWNWERKTQNKYKMKPRKT